MREYLLVLLVAAGTTYLLSGLARSLAVRTGALATVRSRDVHTQPIPYFGGLAMFGGLAVAFLLALQMPFLGRYTTVEHDAWAVLWAGLVITVIGVLDDKYDMPALVKLGGQVLAAGVAVLQGVRIYWIPLPNRIVALDDATSILITVFFIALCVNAVNFVDGLDGLAAGVVAIGSGAFFSYTYVLAYEQELVRATTASLITVATCGIAIGFLLHNFHPAKMFMGDSGAMLLGLLMAMSAISFTGQTRSGGHGAGRQPPPGAAAHPAAARGPRPPHPRPDPRLGAAHLEGAARLPCRQAAPAPSPARARTLALGSGAADVRVDGCGVGGSGGGGPVAVAPHRLGGHSRAAGGAGAHPAPCQSGGGGWLNRGSPTRPGAPGR